MTRVPRSMDGHSRKVSLFHCRAGGGRRRQLAPASAQPARIPRAVRRQRSGSRFRVGPRRTGRSSGRPHRLPPSTTIDVLPARKRRGMRWKACRRAAACRAYGRFLGAPRCGMHPQNPPKRFRRCRSAYAWRSIPAEGLACSRSHQPRHGDPSKTPNTWFSFILDQLSSRPRVSRRNIDRSHGTTRASLLSAHRRAGPAAKAASAIGCLQMMDVGSGWLIASVVHVGAGPRLYAEARSHSTAISRLLRPARGARA